MKEGEHLPQEYCIYLRKSRADLEAEARGEGETLARHEKTLLELARRLKLNIGKIYREIVSGETIAARPEMQKLLEDVKAGMWKGVLVMEVERLARGDTIDQGIVAQTFKYSQAKIITPLKTYDPNNEFDEEYFEFGLFMSRREYKTTNRRLQNGRLRSVMDGKYVASKPPYGYLRKKIPNDKGYTLEPHPEQAKIVPMIYHWFVFGEEQPDGSLKQLGTSLIAGKLNRLGIKSYTGELWSAAAIKDILTNPVYIGKIRWKWRPHVKKVLNGQRVSERPRSKDAVIVQGIHPGIVKEDLWVAAQDLIKMSGTPVPKQQKIKNPLAGLVVCGVCGRKMVRRPYGNYPAALICPKTNCANVSSHLHLVEAHVVQSLQEWMEHYRMKINQNQEGTESTDRQLLYSAIVSIHKDLEKLNKQMDRLHDLLEQGVYSIEVFITRSKNISNRIEDLQKEKSFLEEELKRLESLEYNKVPLIPKMESIMEAYHATEDPELKNSLLKEVISKVVYKKSEGGRWSNKLDEFQLDLYPVLPQIPEKTN